MTFYEPYFLAHSLPVQRRKPGKQTISLTSTPRGVGAQREAPATHHLSSEPEKSNVWIKTDSTILYLSQLLSVPPGTLSSLFYSNNNSLPLAVSKILDQAEAYHEVIPEEEAKLARIRELFPTSALEPLRRCLYATEGDIPKTVELYKVLEDIHMREGTPLAHGLLLQTKPRNTKPTALAAAPIAQQLAQQSPASPVLHRTRSDRPPTAQECLLIANAIRTRRDDAYRSAARTWRGKAALGNSGVAAYWADHARQLDREAKQWELKAARETVEERRKAARSAQSIDLHGLTASQALTVTNESLNSWWHSKFALCPMKAKLSLTLASIHRPLRSCVFDHSYRCWKALSWTSASTFACRAQAPRERRLRLEVRRRSL